VPTEAQAHAHTEASAGDSWALVAAVRLESEGIVLVGGEVEAGKLGMAAALLVVVALRSFVRLGEAVEVGMTDAASVAVLRSFAHLAKAVDE
jgi:hypothetical protein